MTLPQVVGLVGIVVFTIVFVAGLLLVADASSDFSDSD